MTIVRLLATVALLVAAAPTPPAPAPALAPGKIVAAAPAADWVAIAPSDLLVMTLRPDVKGRPRQVIIQLMPPPFSQGWIGNIRKLAAAQWWDETSVNRVQDNYVVQWGDANAEDKAKAKVLPEGLATVPESRYATAIPVARREFAIRHLPRRTVLADPYAGFAFVTGGWPVAMDNISDTPVHESAPGRPVAPTAKQDAWPIHCYGMVGVGRNLSPDTGSGAELYTVIGQAPRHLDRNIALVGRVIEGIEHLSSLPRGTEALGFYKTAEERTPIVSIRLASELPAAEQPHFEYLSTESASFAHYADARANRRDAFFIRPAGGADICNIPVPIRRVTG